MLCEESGGEADMVSALQRSVQKYRTIADDHAARWQAASRELEGEQHSLLTEANMNKELMCH